MASVKILYLLIVASVFVSVYTLDIQQQGKDFLSQKADDVISKAGEKTEQVSQAVEKGKEAMEKGKEALNAFSQAFNTSGASSAFWVPNLTTFLGALIMLGVLYV